MKLFPDGTITEDSDPRDNTFILNSAMQILNWRLPADGKADSELIVQCQMVPHGLVAAFPSPLEWHMGFMLRSKIEDIPTGQYKGLGPILGPVWRPELNPQGVPGFVDHPGEFVWRLEDWAHGSGVPPTYESLRTGSCSPVIKDGQRLRVWMSCKRYAGEVYSRLILATLNNFAQYTPILDTGDVQSNNWVMDRWQETLTLFNLGGQGACDYSIEVINLTAQQQWALCRIPDARKIVF